MISTQENVRIEEVKLKRKYINSGDVFILDLGLRMIQVYIIPPYYRQHYTCFNERRERRKKEASKVKQINKAKQHSTPKAVTFPKKNELPWVGHMYMYCI